MQQDRSKQEIQVKYLSHAHFRLVLHKVVTIDYVQWWFPLA